LITGITLVKPEVSVSDFFFERMFLTSHTGILLKNFLRETLAELVKAVGILENISWTDV